MLNKVKLPIILTLFFSGFFLFTSNVGNCNAISADNRATFYGKLTNLEKKGEKKGEEGGFINGEKIVIKVGSKYFYITNNTKTPFNQVETLRGKDVQVFYDKTNYHVINIFKDIREEKPR